MDNDFLSALVDEVALEGLDGVTLSMLWLRLQNRHFPIELDDLSKPFLWNCVAVHTSIEMYELPVPRVLTPVYNRYEHIDNELGIVLENTEEVIDPYPISVVNDGNIRGSCSTYKSRVCITSEIRSNGSLLISLSEVNEKWGEKLVLVASPKVRLLALIGSDSNPLLELSTEQYCLLERIGRSRYHGEVTQGKGGLLSLHAPFNGKQIHYLRKKLTLKGLVTKQMHYMKSRKGHAVTGSLYHLTRFYVQRKTKMELLMKCICDVLKEKPHNREKGSVLRDDLQINEKAFKKLFHGPFQKCLKIVTIPYREFFPNATQKEMLTVRHREKFIKVVQLIKHIDELDDTEFNEINDDKERALPIEAHFDFSKLHSDVPLISQVYRFIKDAGPKGISSASLRQILTLPRLDVRTLLGSLTKKDLVVTTMLERGRQKETVYIAKTYLKQSEFFSEDVVCTVSKNNLESPPCNYENKCLKRNIAVSPNDASEPVIKKVKFSSETSEMKIENKNAGKENTGKENTLVHNKRIVSSVFEVKDCDVLTDKSLCILGLDKSVASSNTSSSRLTDRKLKRIKMILDNVKSFGLCTLYDLQRYLIDKEKEEGYNFKIDKKSTVRVIFNLFMQKKLRIYKVVLQSDEKKVEIELICDNSIEPDDFRIPLAVDQAKFKYFSMNTKSSDKKVNHQTDIHKNALTKEKTEILNRNAISKNEVLEKKDTSSSLAEKKAIESYVHPKCVRFKTLHKFLFYLVYGYEGHSGDDSKVPVVYHDSMTWKRFVPPLTTMHKEGWCFLADVYSRMPLSIFIKVFNSRHRVRYLVEYLNDEEKCHYLVSDLPLDVKNNLFHRRRYIFAFDDILKGLCYMGLITFGPHVSKLKQELYLYIHKTVAFKDTTISPPGYIHINDKMFYEKRIFDLKTLDNVENFWVDLEWVTLNTNLGRYSCVTDKTVVIAVTSHKPELIEALKNKQFDEVVDVGHIPGDGLGAAGFDSLLFLHAKRNWLFSTSVKINERVNVTESNSNISMQNLLKYKDALEQVGQNRLKRLNPYHLPPRKNIALKPRTKKTKQNTSKLSVLKKRKVKFRTLKVHNKKKIRQTFYDDVDIEALKKMTKARCDWSAQEDCFLLLCKVASSFLNPTSRTLVVPYSVVRDLLHEKFPEVAANKTSRACQRRTRYMMLNSTTLNNVITFLGEAKQDMGLMKEFDKIKPPRANEAAWRELFTRVLKRFLEKFTSTDDRCKIITLPSSMQEFNRTFKIMHPQNVFHRKNNHKNPEIKEQVKYATLYFLIFSAMAIKCDGTKWSHLLNKLYQAYPDNVLKSVVDRLRNEKVIALNRKICKRDLQSSLLSTFPYRFSISYENALLTNFSINLFTESKELIDVLKLVTSNDLELNADIAPGYVAAIIALSALDDLQLTIEVPDQVILFDTSLSTDAQTKIVKRMISTLSDKESVDLSKFLSNEKDQFDDERRRKDSSQDDLAKRQEDFSYITHGAQHRIKASRLALHILRQELSLPPHERGKYSHDYIILNTCKVFCKLKSNIDISMSFDNDTCKPNASYLMSNLNKLKAGVLTDGRISEIKKSLTTFIPPQAFILRDFNESLEEIYDAYSSQTLNAAKCIFEEIFKTCVLGISERNMHEKFHVLDGELTLFEHLYLLRENMLVIRAGVASFVYVCMCFAKNWVLTSYVLPENSYKNKSDIDRNEKSKSTGDCKMVDENEFSEIVNESLYKDIQLNLQGININFSKEIHFLPRTWRHPDGTLNILTFTELLQTVLSYIISSPGISSSCVIEHFLLVMPPVQTLELLEVLEKSFCIKKYFLKSPPKKTLFSKPSDIFITKNPYVDDVDHLEPYHDAICKLARVEEAIIQS